MTRVIFNIFAIPLGVIAIVAGEADDSPGLQGLGLMLLLIVFYRSFKQLKAVRAGLKKRID